MAVVLRTISPSDVTRWLQSHAAKGTKIRCTIRPTGATSRFRQMLLPWSLKAAACNKFATKAASFVIIFSRVVSLIRWSVLPSGTSARLREPHTAAETVRTEKNRPKKKDRSVKSANQIARVTVWREHKQSGGRHHQNSKSESQKKHSRCEWK